MSEPVKTDPGPEAKAPERRKAFAVPITVCKEGHVVSENGPAQERWQMRCPRCGDWTWEDGNYCTGCGNMLKEPLFQKRAPHE